MLFFVLKDQVKKVQEVIKGTEEIIITITDEVITGIEVMIGIGVDHLKGRVGI